MVDNGKSVKPILRRVFALGLKSQKFSSRNKQPEWHEDELYLGEWSISSVFLILAAF